MVNDSTAVAQAGKGQFLIAVSHYVHEFGNWPALRNVMQGDAKGSAPFAPAPRYENSSVSFIYVDGCRHGRLLGELTAWWPKLHSGGRMCGDDGGVKSVRRRLNHFFSKAAPKLIRHEPKVSWELVSA